MSGVIAGLALMYLAAIGLGWFFAMFLWMRGYEANPDHWRLREDFPRKRDRVALRVIVEGPLAVFVVLFFVALGSSWVGR